MKKVISFSLWGTNGKYTVGAWKNAELAQSIYPGWICRFYVGTSVPLEIVDKLKSYSNTEVIEMGVPGDWTSMFWRFTAIDDPDVSIALSRDADSRLSMREKLCVDEFEASDKLFHSMIDHPFHSGIMGGMWGIKKGLISSVQELIDKWAKQDSWNTDQSFLNSTMQPLVQDQWLLHSIHLKNFPSKRENYHFVGEIFDAEDHRYEHYGALTDFQD